jgi:DNA polymerase elongation subunit (family B)
VNAVADSSPLVILTTLGCLEFLNRVFPRVYISNEVHYEMQHEVLAILAEAHDYESYLQKLEVARMVLTNYEERLAGGDVEIKDLVVSKRITKEPRDYQKAGVTAIAAQQLFGSGVKLCPGQNIEYVITNAEAHVPNDRVRAYALWEG